MNARDAAACDRLLAEAIYSSGVSFNFVENPAFIRFLKCLRPAYTPLSRYQIAGLLLTETYKETKEKMEKVLERASGQITLVSDRWTNLRGKAIVNYVAVTRRYAIFLKLVATGQDRHTGEYIANGLTEVVECLKVNSLIYSRLLMLRCPSYIVNLTVGNIFSISLIGNLFKLALEVVKYFKYLYILIGLLNAAVKNTNRPCPALQMPGRTLIKNCNCIKIAMRRPEDCLPSKLIKEQKARFNRIQSIVQSYRFWEQLQALKKFLELFL
ncbi:hypothetical protein K469DRAFT_721098 [Zopfia rhizophila CBS 207.26]|uniref:DUF659 domain-containing protein n=1 Tax=Zopfia rhizophila CBS 207.26 TaxID=1314779 RepID=A0A6A6DF31_9PEZI|nr:hypothetical protein K469DRAFT_721098 [Zopfia rhizophila CBS 207.26]